MEVRRLVLGPVHTNVYLVYEKEKREGVIIDPAAGAEAIQDAVRELGFSPRAILLTHGHFDHIGAAETLRQAYRIPVLALRGEEEYLEDPEKNGGARFLRKPLALQADRLLEDGEQLELCGESWTVIGTPGHTKGSCCYYLPSEQWLFCGDTLFAGSYGRCDFYGGDIRTLCHSITEKLFALPDQVAAFPGHMEETTLGVEKKSNPIRFERG